MRISDWSSDVCSSDLVEDEVDNARDRVRTIDRRGTAGQHVDPVNERGRNDVDVGGRRAGVARQQTAAVHQHQGALRTEAAKVDGRGAGRAVVDIAARAGEDLRQRVDEVFRPGDALELNFLVVDDGDRAGDIGRAHV